MTAAGELAPRRPLIVGFVAALGLLAATTWLQWRHSAHTQQTADWVAQTHEVEAELYQLLALVEDIETGERGYVLTGDPAFLGPFEAGVASVAEQHDRLMQLIRDDAQKASVSALKPLIAQQIALSRRNVNLRRTSGFEAARQAVIDGEGKAVMDEIRAEYTRIHTNQMALLEQRSGAARREAAMVPRVIVGGTVVSTALLIVVFALVLRENRLRQRAQDQLDRFFTLSLDMLCIAGMDGHFKRLSPAFNQTLGYTTDELLARPFLDFVHPDDRAATLAEVEKLSHGAPTIQFENRYRCKDGSWKWLSWTTRPFPSEGLLYATARDITEGKHAEVAVRELNTELHRRAARLEDANKELETFSYSVSHDLRAPLRHVHGYAEMLTAATDGQLSDKAKRCLNVITEATTEMDHLIDDLLAFSRMGQAELHESCVELDALVQHVLQGLEMATRGRHITWNIAPLPQVLGDPSMLVHVLANLVGNAVKYSRPRDQAQIDVGCLGEEDGQAIIFVRDNGVGFDMKYADKLFGVFQRLHRPEEFEGTGIGLANVRRIIARHGGRTWAEGAVDQGATFYFTLKPSPAMHSAGRKDRA